MKFVKKTLLTLSMALFVATPLSAYIFKTLLLKKNNVNLFLLYDHHKYNLGTTEQVKEIIKKLKTLDSKIVIIEGPRPLPPEKFSIVFKKGLDPLELLLEVKENPNLLLTQLHNKCEKKQITVKNIETRKTAPGDAVDVFKQIYQMIIDFVKKTKEENAPSRISSDLVRQYVASTIEMVEKQKTKIEGYDDGEELANEYNKYLTKLKGNKDYQKLKDTNTRDEIIQSYFKEAGNQYRPLLHGLTEIKRLEFILHRVVTLISNATQGEKTVDMEILHAIAEAEKNGQKNIFVVAGYIHVHGIEQPILRMGYKGIAAQGKIGKKEEIQDMKQTFEYLKKLPKKKVKKH